jgi:hypothetical protein
MQKVVEGDGRPGAPPPATTAPSPRPRVRWLLIALPVVLLIVKAIAALADVGPLGDELTWRRSFIDIGLAVISLGAAVGLVAGLRIGWLLALWIVGWDLVLAVARWWLGEPNYAVMILAALVAFLLTTRDMQVAYGVRRAP